MKCPYCNMDNPDGQKFCGNCGKPIMDSQPQQNSWIDDRQQVQRMPKFYELTWVIILACIFIPPLGIAFLWMSSRPKNTLGRVFLTIFMVFYSLMWIVSVIPSTDSDKKSETETVAVESEKKDDSEPEKTEETEEAEEQEEDETLTVGSSFESGGLKIIIDDADLDFQDYEDDYGWNTPSDGMKYIMAAFTFENTGKDDEYVSLYDFDCYADNVECDQEFTLDDDDFINTNLSSGRKVSFKAYFEVPQDAESIELEYETNLWTSDKVIIKLQ